MNTVNIIGRLTKDVELRKTNNDKAVCSFCIAVDGGQEKTYFIDCVAWGSRAETISKYFHKGGKIGISGELTTRSWQDNSGNNRKATEVNVLSIDFCDSKKANDSLPSKGNRTQENANTGDLNALPFEV